MSSKAVSQYLERYAEPESRVAGSLEGCWDAFVVLPACGEDTDLFETFERVDPDARRVLCVLVVNHAQGASKHLVARNERVLRAAIDACDRRVSLPGEHRIELVTRGRMDWLLIDRSTSGFALPEGQGVGLARKIGCDFALAAWRAGVVRSDWIWTTDADVRVPAEYFEVEEKLRAPLGERASSVSAVTLPFRHQVDLETVEGRALAVYEIRLRYYTLGLATARSPYAFHTVGSTFCVRSADYAAVRGFPRRNAGEDFYLLNKLAKVGGVAYPDMTPVHIRQRQSDRVPFGTGQAMAEIARLDSHESYLVYAPEVFEALACWISFLEEFCARRDLDGTLARIRQPEGDIDTRMFDAIGREEVEQRLLQLRAQHSRPEALRRAVHTWFDAFRTLKFVHALRDRHHPSLPIREALRRSKVFSELAELPLEELLDRMFEHERRLLGRVCGLC